MQTGDRPQFSQIDAWGATHSGVLREHNEDHFFVGAIARGVTVDATSIADDDRSVLHAERLASLAMVADGVGGRAGGEEAARTAVRTLVSKVSEAFHEADYRESEDPEVFTRLLHEAALACHESLLHKAEQEGDERRFSTTLTLFLGLWPHAYLLQVGDSRCYILRGDELTQITRDQTVAQELIDSGALTQTVANKTRWAHVLSSSMGGEQAAPVVTRVTRDWGNVVLLGSDGLTKHVSDDQIRRRLSSLTDARSACEHLIQDALDDGGTDNIPVIVCRSVPSS
mgnify:CR=1 FL=1